MVLSVSWLFAVIIFIHFDNYSVINNNMLYFSFLKGLDLKKTLRSRQIQSTFISVSLSLTHAHTRTHKETQIGTYTHHRYARQSQPGFTAYTWHGTYGSIHTFYKKICILGKEVGASALLFKIIAYLKSQESRSQNVISQVRQAAFNSGSFIIF